MILIIDDDPDFTRSLKLHLEEQSFIVVTFSSSLQSLKFLEKQIPDLIILDIILPEIDGYDFLKFLRESKKFYYIPVIVLTAKSLVKDRIKAYSLGCNAYLSKPFSLEELLSIIYNLIEQSKNYLYGFNSYSTYTKSSLKQTILPHTLSNSFELTCKEQKALNLVIEGYMNKEIARNLNISHRHVERYISRLFNKFNVGNRTELVRIALSNFYSTN
uniref:hypothetical protein n=1 Tax=Chroodactylon ornatum TaxID=139907 RepID=UPI001FCD157A|nr:hypothetical protein MW609_pgp006 [Chroodactylon ornatum]UNJ14693.1 hypothetical protein [Chroodactylon ornatum]